MPDPDHLRAAGARIESLLADLNRTTDPAVAAKAEELVRLVVELYGAGLARVVEIAGAGLVGRLAQDDLVASLLVLHGLHPKDTRTRVVEALDRVRPYLGSHAGGVQLLGIDADGVVRLRLEGTCHGCPSSTLTVRMAIEQAIEAAAPEVSRVDVDGVVDSGVRESPLLQIQPFRPAPGPCPVPEPSIGAPR